MKDIDKQLQDANANGTIDKKALAIKVAAMVGLTAASILGTVLVQRAIDSSAEDTPAE